MRERLVALAVLLVGLAVARSSPPAIAAVAVGLPLAATVLGPRLRVDRVGQAALAIGAMVLGVLVPRLLGGPEIAGHDPRVLGQRALLLAMPMLAVAAARAAVHEPVFGARLTLTAALVALTAGGRAASGLAYPVLAALALAAGLAALHAADPARPRARLLGAGHLAAIALGAACAIGLAFLAWWRLPALHDAAIARLMARYNQSRTHLSGQMYLGDMAGMLQSDVVVMRVRGGEPPLLRGTVFTTYASGRWESDATLSGIEVVETATEPADPGGYVEIENARKPARYFVPLGARDVLVSTGVYERDVLLVHRPSLRFEAKRLWFAEGAGPQPLPPRPIDRRLPARLEAALRAVLADWGVGEAEPGRRIEAIAARLRSQHRYSVSFDRARGVDPVVDFLTRNRQGHCEYFASALALLARASDVPARLVAGYRVVETSPLGYHVVRERHAHSWAEVWIDGRWVTVDPTPAADLAAASPLTTPLLGALADGVATAWERVDDWLGRRSAFEMSLILVGLVALLLAARVLRGRRARPAAAADLDPPLEGFVALAGALAARGLGRSPAETLSCFASRVEEEAAALPAAVRARAAALVRRYEGLRYAGRGDAGVLEREMLDAARAVSGAASPSPAIGGMTENR